MPGPRDGTKPCGTAAGGGGGLARRASSPPCGVRQASSHGHALRAGWRRLAQRSAAQRTTTRCTRRHRSRQGRSGAGSSGRGAGAGDDTAAATRSRVRGWHAPARVQTDGGFDLEGKENTRPGGRSSCGMSTEKVWCGEYSGSLWRLGRAHAATGAGGPVPSSTCQIKFCGDWRNSLISRLA